MDDGLIDLLVIGGGINGTGIARDAAGRGLSVVLVEKDDLAAHTSSMADVVLHANVDQLAELRVHRDEVHAERAGGARFCLGDFRVEELGRHCSA